MERRGIDYDVLLFERAERLFFQRPDIADHVRTGYLPLQGDVKHDMRVMRDLHESAGEVLKQAAMKFSDLLLYAYAGEQTVPYYHAGDYLAAALFFEYGSTPIRAAVKAIAPKRLYRHLQDKARVHIGAYLEGQRVGAESKGLLSRIRCKMSDRQRFRVLPKA